MNIFDTIMSYVPIALLVGIILIPYGMLANETYKAVYKTSKVPIATAILNYIPLYNYIVIRKYLYGKGLPAVILTVLTAACLLFRALAIIVWGTSDPWMIAISVYVAIAGVVLWYLTMAFTSCYTAILTRRGIITIILGTLLPPFGAFIVSKNIRRHFKVMLEEGSEFRDNNRA